jgi:hypothetical protein
VVVGVDMWVLEGQDRNHRPVVLVFLAMPYMNSAFEVGRSSFSTKPQQRRSGTAGSTRRQPPPSGEGQMRIWATDGSARLLSSRWRQGRRSRALPDGRSHGKQTEVDANAIR